MTFSEYQEKALETAVYPDIYSIYYPALGLAGEAGEIANKVKKILRGDDIRNSEYRLSIAKEIGDLLWYAATLAHDLGCNFDDIAKENLEKLAKRKEAGTLKGSGDNR